MTEKVHELSRSTDKLQSESTLNGRVTVIETEETLPSSMLISGAFSLQDTFDCGQCFRFEKVTTENEYEQWVGTAQGRFLKLEQRGDNIKFYCSIEEFEEVWRSYFDLDTDYNQIKKKLSLIDPQLKEIVEFTPGIRILRQDPFEALISFIISQNNHIPRIRGIIRSLSILCGNKINSTQFCFPTADLLSKMTVEDLATIRAGFRAKYIIAAAKHVTENREAFEKIAEQPVSFGRTELQKIYGVGPKVAECVLLYGFHKTECFPMDVWMKRAMKTLFPQLEPTDFENNAGIAQQYIFHYSRLHPTLFQNNLMV